ncbi:hypothetical protein [Clostridium gasigenes]|uniref:hypothetical protein n=1 Tax=Clostridium gasigenes TaxID=94869 RepID=UPI00143857FE|nr:hypothetical protein [Clostridium gasigenes]MBU3105597.1 hypothetical protein [Clostridium gasigenes]NKF06852.1 hypothetical protein [Clostridium gasigenes]QSW19879.1 hypothetical protein J1C67_01365 [Clostridium gasigenes]
MFDKIKKIKNNVLGKFVIDFIKKPENIKQIKNLISKGVDNKIIAEKLNIPSKYVDKIKKMVDK